MQTILFDRSSNKITGIGREKLPYEYSVHVPFDIQLSKTVQESTGQLIQKVNSENQPLYKDEIVIDEITGEESYIEVTTSQKVTAFEIVKNVYKIAVSEEMVEQVNEFGETVLVPVPVYEEIVTNSENPISWDDLEQIMIPEIINKTVTLENNMFEFDYEEVLEAKKQAINNNNLLSLCFYDEDFLGNDLVLSGCSIGDGILILHPQGFITTPIITLTKFTSIIGIYQESQNSGLEFYINDIPVIDGRIKLSTNVNEIIIKVSNPTNKNLELYCLGGLC